MQKAKYWEIRKKLAMDAAILVDQQKAQQLLGRKKGTNAVKLPASANNNELGKNPPTVSAEKVNNFKKPASDKIMQVAILIIMFVAVCVLVDLIFL